MLLINNDNKDRLQMLQVVASATQGVGVDPFLREKEGGGQQIKMNELNDRCVSI